jgi:hypothetical protein
MQSIRLRFALHILALTAANTVYIRFIATVWSPAGRIRDNESIAVHQLVDDRPKQAVSTATNSRELG